MFPLPFAALLVLLTLLLSSCSDSFAGQDKQAILKDFPAAIEFVSTDHFVAPSGRAYFPFIKDKGFLTASGFSIPVGPKRKDGSRAVDRVGLWCFCYGESDPKGLPLAQGNYVDGEPSGDWRFWYPDGSPRAAGSFEAGAMDGLWSVQEPDGSLDAVHSGVYRAGKRIGDLPKK